MASSYSAKECQICQDEYNEEEKCPRGLPCSHTLCSECLQNIIIRNLKTCPFCLRKFTATSARDIGVNTSLVDVLKLLRETEMRVSAQPESLTATKSTRMNDQKRETDEVLNLLESLTQADDELDRQLLSNTQLVSCLSEAKETILKEIQPCINEVFSQNSSTTSYLEEHSKKPTNQTMTIIETELKSAQECFQFAKTTKELLTKLKDAVNSIRMDEFSIIHELQQMDISKDLKILRSIPQPVTIANVQSRSGLVIELMRQKLVFAVKELDGQRRYAEISLQEKNRICLHCLKKQNIPSNAHILQHSDVLNLMDVSSRLVFLQLSLAEEKTLGKLFIRLSPDSKRAQQFSLLCSGENTASYVNRNILNVFWKDTKNECVAMGDCENMNGKGGRSLVPDVLKEEGGVFRQPQMAGTVQGRGRAAGDKKASQFFIYTHGNPEIEREHCFGMVEDGLPILQEAIRHFTDKRKVNVSVSDSGLVLPF